MYSFPPLGWMHVVIKIRRQRWWTTATTTVTAAVVAAIISQEKRPTNSVSELWITCKPTFIETLALAATSTTLSYRAGVVNIQDAWQLFRQCNSSSVSKHKGTRIAGYKQSHRKQENRLSLTNCPMHLCNGQRLGSPLKQAPPICVATPNLVVLCRWV